MFTFNGVSKPFVRMMYDGNQRPMWAEVDRDLIEIPGRPGAFLRQTKTKVRELSIPIMIDGVSDLQKAKEEVAEWLVTDKPEALIFPDEPDRIYYAMVNGTAELNELFKFGKGTVTFICPDPYKYGTEQSFTIGAPLDPDTNQIKNGDFREGVEYWYSSSNIGEVVPVSSDQVEFKQAFEINQPDIYLIYYFDNPNWWRGKKGYASCWVNIKNSAFGSGNGAVLYFRATKSSDGSYIYFQDDARLKGDTNGWIQLSFPFDFSTITEEIDQLYFAISTAGGFTVVEAQFTGFMVTFTDELTPWLPDGTGHVKSNGTAPTHPIVECTFTEAAEGYDVQLLNSDTSLNKGVSLAFDFIAGDKLVIDFSKRLATLNGEKKNTAFLIKSDFYQIPPKKDTLIRATQPSTIKFKDRYL
ncbi:MULTISPECIES: distal tail protein Dit [Bacillus]|uniref:distal tail protein Dit n=1 Tax=Bacillus TaxID=1386 RepID=UPI0022819155|nr:MULTISPECIES: distal tail protein Dit [Bacillus]MCY8180901.1 phage tail family protein [Bacillus paralicheniformis]MCY8664888.1 phage tail family protein [Bacillus haynesii]MCY8712476.1 phage tail family protein [Bacillus haynesii]